MDSIQMWATVFDPDYDKECDGPAGVFVAAHCYWDNPHSACLALLRIGTRSQKKEEYDALMAWLLTLPEGLRPMSFETHYDKWRRK